MRPTRRFVGAVCLAVGFVAFALVLRRPLFAIGAGGLIAWVLTDQCRFVLTLGALDDELTVEQSIERDRVAEGGVVGLSIRGWIPGVDLAGATLTLRPPAAIDGIEDATIDLSPGRLEEHFSVSSEIAGRHVFDAPRATITSPNGLFTESFSVGPPIGIRVEAPRPRDIHVGAGGDRVAAGEHPGRRGQRSTELRSLRAYQPGDAANRIDWNATARLGDPFVREFEPHAERRTHLVVDHREAMGTGDVGETKLDYARELALTVADYADENDDPIALTTVGDDGLTGALDAGTSAAHYRLVRTRIADLTATEPDDRTGGFDHRAGPAVAHRNSLRLRGDSGAFARTLAPYLEHAETYVRRLDGDPLFGAVETEIRTTQGTPWVVIVSDDAHPLELRETVKLARRRDRRVAVFITPTVLYETHGLTDLNAAYERYVSFEEQRRTLDALDRVSAYEVAPGDRITALLAANRPRLPTPTDV